MRNLKTHILKLFLALTPLFVGCHSNADETAEERAMIADEVSQGENSSAVPPQNNSGENGAMRIPVNDVGAFYQVFNDSNHQQLEVAQRLGIHPIIDVPSAYNTGRPIVKIESCDLYQIDSLTHSLPYLVPEAARLLADIGSSFNDSLKARGADGNIIKVTSLLRTPESVSRLRRVNINATDSSTHQYGTTFDISYTNFYCREGSRQVNQGDLKNLLAEVLNELRANGRCFVKYERKTGCFHITAIQ